MMIKPAALALALLFAVSGYAHAGLPIDEVRAGAYVQGCCGFGSTKEDGAAFNAEAIFSSPRALAVVGAPRPLIGATFATDGDAASQIYTGLEWRFDFGRWFVAPGVGLTLHNGETDTYDPILDAARVDETVFYGCRVLFRISGDVGYRLTETLSASFHWNHISNAGLCANNEGLDQIGLRLGVSF